LSEKGESKDSPFFVFHQTFLVEMKLMGKANFDGWRDIFELL
jgi:hypothetical protein